MGVHLQRIPSDHDKSQVNKAYAGCTRALAQSPAHYLQDATEQIQDQRFSYELMDFLVRCTCLKHILYFILSLLIELGSFILSAIQFIARVTAPCIICVDSLACDERAS